MVALRGLFGGSSSRNTVFKMRLSWGTRCALVLVSDGQSGDIAAVVLTQVSSAGLA